MHFTILIDLALHEGLLPFFSYLWKMTATLSTQWHR